MITLSSCNNTHDHYYERSSREGRAIEILEERYARGEISKEEYVQTRKELER